MKTVKRFFLMLWRLPWLVMTSVGMIIYLVAIAMLYGMETAEKQFELMR